MKGKDMQLQLNVNELKLDILLEFLDTFKKDKLINDYEIIPDYNEDEKNILNDLKNFNISLENGIKTDKFVYIDDK